MGNVREQFDKLMQERCRPEEMCTPIICYESDERMQDMINFILKNNLNCIHLWENNEEGDKAYEDYLKIDRHALLYEGIIEEDDDGYPPKQYIDAKPKKEV